MDTTHRSKLLDAGVDKETLSSLEVQFKDQFKQILRDYEIDFPSENQDEILDTGVEVLFEIIYEFGTDDNIDESVQEYAAKVADDTGQSARYNVQFVCGRAAGQYPETEFAEVARSLRGAIAMKNYSDNSP